jgi:hypothetical protein
MSQFDSSDTVTFVLEGPGDTTRRPRRPGIPYMGPNDPYPPMKPIDSSLLREPPKEQPPASEEPKDKPGDTPPAA